MSKKINEMTHNELIAWVDRLTNKPFDKQNKDKIKKGMKDFEATGSDVFDVEADDLADSFGINAMLAKRLFAAINDQKQKDYTNAFSGRGRRQPSLTGWALYMQQTQQIQQVTRVTQVTQVREFSLNLQGQKGSYVTLDKIRATDTIKSIKEEYLRAYGQDLNNKQKRKGLNLRRLGEPLSDENKTLADYQIFDGTIALSVIFRVNGGMAFQLIDDGKEQSEQIQIEHRIRKLRKKKHSQIIKISQKPDCIMGYTEKSIKRAEMPCGCAFASDTMYRYMVAAFDKDDNFRAVKMSCPMPKGKCTGSDEQRDWDWSLVFIIADLTAQEKNTYSQIIDRRIAGHKACPHCHFNCERPKDLTIFRVKCVQCNKQDWCWECSRVWIGSGLTVCGNGGCVRDRLNKILNSAKMINPSWSKDIKMPDIRHCPSCLTLIEYQDLCAHMTCVGCPFEFCFKCLKKWEGKNYYSHCTDSKPAPIQQI